MSAATDQELVIGFRPEARVQFRVHPRSGVPQFRVSAIPVRGGAAPIVSGVGFVSETLAWGDACARMGLRVRRAGRP